MTMKEVEFCCCCRLLRYEKLINECNATPLTWVQIQNTHKHLYTHTSYANKHEHGIHYVMCVGYRKEGRGSFVRSINDCDD